MYLNSFFTYLHIFNSFDWDIWLSPDYDVWWKHFNISILIGGHIDALLT